MGQVYQARLNPPDETIALDGRGLIRTCRAQDSGRQSEGLCVYVNNVWCSGAVKVDGRGAADVDFLMLRCQPFHLPQDSSVFMLLLFTLPQMHIQKIHCRN